MPNLETSRDETALHPAALSDLEATLLARVDTDRLVTHVGDLVGLATLPGEETDGQRFVAERLREIGMAVEEFDIDMPALARDPWYSAEVERGSALGVIGRSGGGSGPATSPTALDGPSPRGRSLLLNGHLDVVPTGDGKLWTDPPFTATVRDGRVYGRGTCDMKGGLAAAIHAVEVINDAGITLDGEVALASVVGEEDGGSGTLAALRHGLRADGCVIMEPTDLAVVPAVAGALSWRIRIPGASAHGCLREEGVSAIEHFWPVHQAVLELERQRNAGIADGLFDWLERPFAICGGRIAGGDWPSSEAEWLIWEGRYGIAPGEDVALARDRFERTVASAAHADPWLRVNPPTVEWWGGQFYPGRTDLDDPIVTSVCHAALQVIGERPAVRGMPYGCDLGLTVGVGQIPTVVFGPGDIRDAHRADESVPLQDLDVVTKVLILTILRTCGIRREAAG